MVFFLWWSDLRCRFAGVPTIYTKEPVRGNKDQHECDQRPAQFTRDAGVDLQSHQGAGAESTQQEGEEHYTGGMQMSGKGNDQAVKIIDRREIGHEMVVD